MKNDTKTVYLIDGANYLFRAFYAIRNLSNSKGMPTGALYGLAQMLIKLLRDEAPDLVAVCLDTKEPTFRDEMYSKYKANRKEPPEDLCEQFPYVRPLIEALGLTIVEKDGFEADDVIGTLAREFSRKGYDVVIVSGDKDLMQLVDDRVTILDEMKELRIKRQEVIDRFGVPPDKVVEVLGLAGDTSDNIPGVAGVGPKTATLLIKEYGSVGAVIENADKLKDTLGTKIRNHAEDARLSRRLAEIKTDVPLDINSLDLRPKGQVADKARKLFGELEFHKLISSSADVKEPRQDITCELISNVADLNRVLQLAKDRHKFSFYLVNINEKPAGLAFSVEDDKALYVPIARSGTANLFDQTPAGFSIKQIAAIFADIFSDKHIETSVYDLNSNLVHLGQLGLDIEGRAFDIMLGSYVLDPSADHSLSAVVGRYLNLEFKVSGDANELELAKSAAYIRKLREPIEAAMKVSCVYELFEKIEMPLVGVLVSMQKNGVRVDSEALSRLSAEYGAKMRELEASIYKLAGQEFNINSPKQLGDVLFGKLGLPGAKRTKTGFSTSQDVLEELALSHDLPKLILEYRSLSKLKGTYVDVLPTLVNKTTGRIHTTFNQAATATGRLSSSDPNLQNIPVRGEDGKHIRQCFVAEKGSLLISADYSQIELRVLAHMSGDDVLVDAFAKGLDIHAITAAGIFGVGVSRVTKEERAVGKTVNFATIYGQTPYGLSKQLGIDVHEAARYIDEYFKRYPKVLVYRDQVIADAKRDGFVKTLFGRVRKLPDINSSNGQLMQLAERMAFNTVFQGTAADIIKRAMIDINEKIADLSRSAKMLLQVHDELVFEVEEAYVDRVKRLVVSSMEGAANLSVPIVVDVGAGKSWAEAH